MSDSPHKSRWAIGDLSEESYDLDNYNSQKNRISTNTYHIQHPEEDNEVWHARFVEFFEFSPIPFVVLEDRDIVEQINLSGCELFEKRPGIIIGNSFRRLFAHPKLVDRFIDEVLLSTNAKEVIVTISGNTRVRLHAVRFVENREKIRIGITREVTDPHDNARLRHIMLAAKDAFSIFDIDGHFSADNKAARVLLLGIDHTNIRQLLKHLNVSTKLRDIADALEHKNIWSCPVSLHNKTYLLVMSHIYCEIANTCEYLVKLTPLRTTEQIVHPNKKIIASISQRAATPLTVISSAANLLRNLDPGTVAFERILQLLETNAKVLKGLNSGLNSLNESNDLSFEVEPLISLLNTAADAAREVRPHAEISVQMEEETVHVWVDKSNITRAFTSILLFATENANEIQIEITEHSATVMVTVFFARVNEERVSAIDLEVIQRIFRKMGAELSPLTRSAGAFQLSLNLIKETYNIP